MRVTVVGAGYVGLVTAACFAEMGNNVVCVESDGRKLKAIVDEGDIPFHEPGLGDLVRSNVTAGRLRFVKSLESSEAFASIYFIAVGTPSNPDGSANTEQVRSVARQLGRVLEQDSVVVSKSTVPVGTADAVKEIIAQELRERRVNARVAIVSNPEFLKEGDAVNDFLRPDRVIIGADCADAIEVLRSLYAPFTRNHERLIVMGIRDAEMTKYAANAMLATRISFMNEIANLCEKLGVDVEMVRRGIGSDGRIGFSFIYPGCGFGGSCFPKDVRALIHMAEEAGMEPLVLRATEQRNARQKERMFEKIRDRLGPDLRQVTVGVWGLSFKPGTDDLREASSVTLIERLVESGSRVRAFDPVALAAAERNFPRHWFETGQVELVNGQYEALDGVDALALVTEWKPFRLPDFSQMKRRMRRPIIFDGRNVYDPPSVRREGFEYFGIGR